ncbi:class I adenylate-forming enzyme family protein [Brevibacterium yomogidense]|uniref:O-succinylbenzoic acid--CoA ligase n=1 Tax=Brevibacterium yomogidense TaxID=946573 RepID=A0A1X6X7C6_9MICO|nr:class I adenylate-forming enzyme family protein [Brevibacterium yomogidense]SLM95030.1 O-succinylbenzoic acid--CoA ligase [Brevibacterium yomogidense]
MTQPDTFGRHEDATLARWLADRATVDGRRIAIDDRGVLIDYATLHHRASALADRLAAGGYGAGGRIATLSGNSADHVVAFFACASLGIAFMPLSWRLTPTELAALIRRSNPDLVLLEEEYASVGHEALRQRGLDAPEATGLGPAGVETEVPPARTQRTRRSVVGEDPLLVIFTSGSEAEPKGVVLTHANCFWNNLALSRALPIAASDVVLAMLPQHHVAAWNVQPLLAWWVGATVVMERTFQPDRILQLVQERGVTTMMGVPTQYRLLFDAADAAAADLRSLTTVVVGGATIAATLAQDAAALGVPLTQGYGLTEAGPNVLFLRHEELMKHPGSVGRPYPTVETALMDPESGLPLDGVATGELWVRGPSLFAGYLDDEATTAWAFRDGWMRTGDLAHRDADGIHRIVDRLKNIYVSGGENVAPAEVEAALEAHPLVTRACVVGVPDRVWGERGFAFVVADKPLSPDELRAHARSILAGFKVPAHVEFVDELPETVIGKLDRLRLRREAADGVVGYSGGSRSSRGSESSGDLGTSAACASAVPGSVDSEEVDRG